MSRFNRNQGACRTGNHCCAAFFSHVRRAPAAVLLRASGLMFALAALLAVQGCSMGFTNLHPGENSALYQHLFADIITMYDEPYWLWIRGTITGDLDGDGTVGEEIILATIQKGTPKQPGPIEMAFLVVCVPDEDGTRRAVARQLLFDRSPISRAPRPEYDIDNVVDNEFTRCRAQVIQDKLSLAESVVVYFWTDPLPCSVWYAGYSMMDNKLVKNLETVMWQITPGVLTMNLDRSIEASQYGYQLVFGIAALPVHIAAKIGSSSEAPVWGHVYARNENGLYEQADARFRENYRKLEPIWNQTYLKAIVKGLPPDELAWFEYYLAILNHYLGEGEMARAYIAKCRDNARDHSLLEAIPQVESLIASGPVLSDEEKDRPSRPTLPRDWLPDHQWDPTTENQPPSQRDGSHNE